MKKTADIFTPEQQTSLFGASLLPVSLATGALASWNVRRHAFDDVPTTEKAVRNLARKHLGSNIDVRPVEDLGNAFYEKKKDEAGHTKHVITYDPRVNMSVIAHEIGHGLKPIPRVPLSGLFAPALLTGGLYNIGRAAGLGRAIRGRDIGLSALGAAMYAPTLISEHLATSKAQEVLGEKPKGLGSAYLTYALPPILAAVYGLGAYGVGRAARNKPVVPFMKNSEAYLAGFTEKCAQAGFDPMQLLRQLPDLRPRPNIDLKDEQGTGPVPTPEEEGTFGITSMPDKPRAKTRKPKGTKTTGTLKKDLYAKKSQDLSGVPGGAPSPQGQGSASMASPSSAQQPTATNAQTIPTTPYSPIIAQAIQALQNQTKAIPGAGSLGQTPAGQAAQGGNGILSSINPATAVQSPTSVT